MHISFVFLPFPVTSISMYLLGCCLLPCVSAARAGAGQGLCRVDLHLCTSHEFPRGKGTA